MRSSLGISEPKEDIQQNNINKESPSSSYNACDLLNELKNLIDESKMIDFYELEEDDQNIALDSTQARTNIIFNNNINILDRIIKRYSTYQQPNSHTNREKNISYLVDLVKVSKNILCHKADQAKKQKVECKGRLEHLILISDLLREIIKSALTAEKVICELENRPPLSDMQTELERAIEIRRVFADFRLRLEESEANLGFIRSRLYRTGNIIGLVIGRPYFRYFRPEDRLQFRRLQCRIKNWLAVAPNGSELGEHLWEDIKFSCQLLMDINNREILVENDQKIINKARAVFAKNVNKIVTSNDLKLQFSDLLGRDKNFDKLILNKEDISMVALMDVLNRIAGLLNVPGGSF